ncbi:MAG: hypothetical protein L0287_14925, partial [Anaerolineae bacterium]|nr:hypothetical protein [Anaerolineae bacterium]
MTGFAVAEFDIGQCIKDCKGYGGEESACEQQCTETALKRKPELGALDSCIKDCLGMGVDLKSCTAECKKVPSRPCTMEVKECPDGSYVSRTGPNCEFAPCPGDEDIEPTSITVEPTETPDEDIAPDSTCEERGRENADEAQQQAVFELSSAGAMAKMRAPDYAKYIAEECASITPTPRPEFPIIPDVGLAILMHTPTEEEKAEQQQMCPQKAMASALQEVRDAAREGESIMPDFNQVVADACGDEVAAALGIGSAAAAVAGAGQPIAGG